MIPSCSFDCVSKMIGDININIGDIGSFMYLLAICTYSLEKCSVPSFNWVFGGSVEFFIHLGYEPPFRCIVRKYFPMFSRLPFPFVNGFLCYWKSFHLGGVPFVLLLFFLPGGTEPENIARTNVKEHTACVFI